MKKEFEKRILSSIILIPMTIFFIFQGSVFFAFFLSIFFLTSSYEWIKMNKKDSFKILGLFYLLLTSYLTYLFRENFFFQFILVLLICIFTDLGGYIFGKIFKGPKLTKISPKKTYSGLIGSFILSIIGALIYIKYINLGGAAYLEIQYLLSTKGLENFKLYFLIIILFISLISQIGDLIISYFKRLAKVKDTGNLLPGHGGLLDRVDGIIFAIPISYLLFNYLN
jgi:phosphatidate cytidylyltransferase